MYKINVVDSICGSGKTESAINYMNDDKNSDKKFLYITPYLTEVERIKTSCAKRNFKEPRIFGNKLNGIKYLLNKGENIVSTHALFSYFDNETIDLAYLNNYILIMDEVADVVRPFNISKDDLQTILEKYATVNENNVLTWRSENYEGKFEEYRRLCELSCISVYNNDSNNKFVLLWMFPITVFKAFKEVYLLTYMFNAQVQKYYYDFFNVEYNYLYVKNYNFTDKVQTYDKTRYSQLIHILENEKMNQIGDLDGSLSSSWYKRNKNNIAMTKLKNNCINFFKHISRTTSKFNMWTTFKEYEGILKGTGYAKGFVSLNMRATNDYRDKLSIAYLSNRYFNPVIKNFFISNEINVDEDAFALSELIQFIFRSALRDDREIQLYLPSLRMRNILKEWINN